jgi:hypothetical protein
MAFDFATLATSQQYSLSADKSIGTNYCQHRPHVCPSVFLTTERQSQEQSLGPSESAARQFGWILRIE